MMMFSFAKVVQILIICSFLYAANFNFQRNPKCDELMPEFLNMSWQGLLTGKTDRETFFKNLFAFKTEKKIQECNDIDYLPKFLEAKISNVYQPFYEEACYEFVSKDIITDMGPHLRVLRTVFEEIPMSPKLQSWKKLNTDSFTTVLLHEAKIMTQETIGLDKGKCIHKTFWSNLARLQALAKSSPDGEEKKNLIQAAKIGETVKKICVHKKNFYRELPKFLFSLSYRRDHLIPFEILKESYLEIIGLYKEGNFKDQIIYANFMDFLLSLRINLGTLVSSQEVVKEKKGVKGKSTKEKSFSKFL